MIKIEFEMRILELWSVYCKIQNPLMIRKALNELRHNNLGPKPLLKVTNHDD